MSIIISASSNVAKRLSVMFAVGTAFALQGCGGSNNPLVPPTANSPAVSANYPLSAETSAPISRRITATFSHPMNAASLTSAFTASTAAGILPGVVFTNGKDVTLLLNSKVPVNTAISCRITTVAKDVNGVALPKDYLWTFTTAAVADTSNPFITSTNPANGELLVGTNKKITASFDRKIVAPTVNADTFRLTLAGVPVSGTIGVVENVAYFTPVAALIPNSTYTATVTTGVQDYSDNGLLADRTWTFTTGASADVTAPAVVFVDPATGATEVPTNKRISITFNEGVDPSTVNTETVMLQLGNGSTVLCDRTFSGRTVILSPRNLLAGKTLHKIVVTTGVKDSSGNAFAEERNWSFITAETSVNTPPTILLTTPQNLSVNVDRSTSITVTFSIPMLSSTINTSTFSVDGVAGTVSFDPATSIATFTPNVPLDANRTYAAHVTTGVRDSNGNALAAEKVFAFTTGA